MISAREKGFYQILTSLQIVSVSALFWALFLIVIRLYHDQTAYFSAYLELWLIILVSMIMESLARPSWLRNGASRNRRVVWALSRRQWITMVASITIIMVFMQDLRISRLFLGIFSISSLSLLYFENRYLANWFSEICAKQFSKFKLRTVILGPLGWCESILPEVKRINSMVSVVGIEDTDGVEKSWQTYARRFEKSAIDLLVMPPRHLPDEMVMGLIRDGDKQGYRCWLPLEITRTTGRHFDLQRVGCLDILSPPVEPLENTTNQVVKRIFDISFSLFILMTLFLPLCVVVMVIHRLFSPGPLFFKQSRVGINGVPFMVYKFRSLHPDNSSESTQVRKSDSRVFKGGGFLRKTSIDEIPQFINVLRGEMSVVGPRPHMESHDTEFREIFERYGVRRYVKPGVTGLAQVKGFRGEINRPVDLRNRGRLDNFYVTHWHIVFDVGIVLLTGVSMLKPPKSAY